MPETVTSTHEAPALPQAAPLTVVPERAPVRMTARLLLVGVAAAATLVAGIAVAVSRSGDEERKPSAQPSQPVTGTADAAAAFVPLADYAYADVPEEMMEEMRAEMLAGDTTGIMKTLADQVEARFVVSAQDEEVAIVISFPIDPRLASQPAFRAGVIAGFAAEADQKPGSETIGGKEIATFTPEPGVSAYLWTGTSHMIVVVGEEGGAVRDFLRAYVPALSSTSWRAA